MKKLFTVVDLTRDSVSRAHPALAWILKVFFIALGIVVSCIGVILIPLPGPGSLIVFLGLAILSISSERLGKWLEKKWDWIVVRARFFRLKAHQWRVRRKQAGLSKAE